MLIFTNFATDLMEQSEAERLSGPLGICVDNLSRGYFEGGISRLRVPGSRARRIDGEWRSAPRRRETVILPQMLRIARMLRSRDSLIARLGRRDYEIELADCYWGVYHMIGKMSGAIYILQKV